MTHLKNRMTRITAVLLAMLMVLTVAPLIALPAAAEDNSEFLRIVHIDCGRKYFSVVDLKKIIKNASDNNYTHVELAFGNDGLRFLLDDMSLPGYSYTSKDVTEAIQAGNKAFYNAGEKNELTQEEMGELISYAKSLNIGIIPMFDAPGHLQTVVRAMGALGRKVNYTTPTTSGTSVNYSISPNDTESLDFVAALMEKYMKYFAEQGCEMFNIAADECGFSSMNQTTYTAYATFVNGLAQRVKDAGMKPLAFNDGIYHKNLTTTKEFDTDILVCYWDASTDKYASAADLAAKGFNIINTNNHWYYVIGKEKITGTNWGQYAYSCEYAKQQMSSTDSCLNIDGDSNKTKPVGCMAAIWCDNPGDTANYDNIESYVKTLSDYNTKYFVESTNSHWKTTIKINAVKSLYVGQRTTVSISGATSAAWSIDKTDVLDFSADVKTNGASVIVEAKKAGIATVTATVDGEKYTVTIAVYDDAVVPAVSEIAEGKSVTLSLASSRAAEWKSSNDSVIKLNINTSAVATNSTTGANSVVAQAVEGAAGKEATVTAAYDGGTAEIKLKVVATRDDPDAVTIELEVGKSTTIENIGSDAQITESGIADIAKAEINSKTVGGSTKYDITTIAAGEFYVSTSSYATNPTVKLTFESAGNGQYYIKNASGDYVYPNATYNRNRWSYSSVTGKQAVTVTQNNNGYITISRSVTSGWNNTTTTAYLTLSGTTLDASGNNNSTSGSRIYLYKETKINGTVQNDIVFTGNGEGSTTYVVGGKTYNVVVTAPTEAVNKTLNYNESFALPDGSYVVSNSGEGYVTIADNKVTAGTSDISGVEIKIDVKKDGYVIKHYVYTVKVTAVDFSKIADLPIQLWVTNNGIQYDGSDEWSGTTKTTGANFNNRYAYWLPIKASTGNVYSEDGDMLSNVMPAAISGVKEWGNVYWDKSFQNKDEVEYPNGSSMGNDTFVGRSEWTLDLLKGTLLKSGSYQLNLGDNRVYSGTDFQYVRYYDNAWWTSADRSSWTKIGTHTVTTSGTTSTTGSGGTQIVAYYMYRTDITKEVTTDVIDWGESIPKDSSGVILDFAVKYPDGTTVPSAFPVDGKTLYYNLLKTGDTYRRIYDIQGLETSGYEIYMITVTPTSDSSSTKLSITAGSAPTYSYQGTEKVAWVDDEANLPAKFKDADAKYTSISGAIEYTVGGKPTIKGVEIYSRQGMLVTYYLRPVVTKDSLTVHYRMQSSTADFYSYNINVISGTFFKENIGLGDPTIGRLANGNVENDQNVEQWVTSDLSTMPAIGAEYRYANYKCVSVERSGDGKDVYIYYTFTKDVSFVIDFGSKLEITPIQVSANLATANITGMTVTTSVYGDITFDSNYNIIYTPKTILRGEETFTVVYKGTNLTTGEGGTATFTISIIPASTVLYEDDLIEFEKGWSVVPEGTSASDRNQSTDKLGDGKTYGYDSSYANDTTYSGGSAMTATVNGSATASASFTFTGTGFDLISETGTGTGVIFLDIYSGTETDVANRIKRWVVDTYYGYAYEVDKDNPWLECVWTYGVDKKWHVTRTPVAAEGTSEVVPQNPSEGTTFKTYEPNYTWTKTDKGTLKQIPVINFQDLGRGWGTYTVVITAKYNAFFDHTGAGSYTVCIDGVRIYNTLEDSSIYKKDGEYDPEFFEIRDELINSEDVSGNVNGAAFIDAIGKTSKSDLISNYGPNNEVYLAAGQSITFTLTSDSVAKLMLGLKAPNGASGVTVTVNGKQTPITLGTATDMYYQIYSAASGEKTYDIVITNTGSALVSVTTLKVTHTDSASTQSLLTVNAGLIAEAKAVMLLLIQPEVPVFTPERFEASWSTVTLFRNSVHALMVRTSTDVDHITVDGKEITNFYYAAAFEGWGRNRKLVKYKVFTLFLGNDASIGDYEVVAFDADGVASEAHIATLTGKTGVGKFN